MYLPLACLPLGRLLGGLNVVVGATRSLVHPPAADALLEHGVRHAQLHHGATASPFFASTSSSFLASSTVRGSRARMKPDAQSGSLDAIRDPRAAAMSSVRAPSSIAALACLPAGGVPAATAARRCPRWTAAVSRAWPQSWARACPCPRQGDRTGSPILRALGRRPSTFGSARSAAGAAGRARVRRRGGAGGHDGHDAELLTHACGVRVRGDGVSRPAKRRLVSRLSLCAKSALGSLGATQAAPTSYRTRRVTDEKTAACRDAAVSSTLLLSPAVPLSEDAARAPKLARDGGGRRCAS